ncbi:carbohydrate sulfotransferase 15-like isoform X2 [Pomacea canaliculata]|nr:carbohydrate sulfotransferase 15-like isoform X2 [Pomacea canaliculata]
MNLKKRVFIIVVSCLAVFSAMVFLVSLPGQLSLALREDSDCSRMETIPWERRSVSTMREDYVKPTRIKLDFVEEGFLYQNCCGRPNETAFKFIEPPQYLDNSKSPCWYNSSGLLSCVPYFFVVGVFKCGTTDLFKRITRHPDVLMGQKEIHWFTKLRRFGYSFDWYINQFDPLARAIDADIKRKGRSDLVIGEGSVSYFSDTLMWPNLYGNEFCAEPRHTVAAHIHHLNPKAKIILSLRNPTERLYSKYLFTAKSSELFKNPSPQQFHEYVGKSVRYYSKCLDSMSVRVCSYNHTLARRTKLMIHEGMYSVFLEDWYRVFPREQIYVVRMEDYSLDMVGELQKIYDFLDLGHLPQTEMEEIANFSIVNAGKNYDVGNMNNKSYYLLNGFYKPFNERLARLMKDKKWLWKDSD